MKKDEIVLTEELYRELATYDKALHRVQFERGKNIQATEKKAMAGIYARAISRPGFKPCCGAGTWLKFLARAYYGYKEIKENAPVAGKKSPAKRRAATKQVSGKPEARKVDRQKDEHKKAEKNG